MRVLGISSNGDDQRIFGGLLSFQSQDSFCRKICQAFFGVVHCFSTSAFQGNLKIWQICLAVLKESHKFGMGVFGELIFGSMIFQVLLEAQRNFLGLEF